VTVTNTGTGNVSFGSWTLTSGAANNGDFSISVNNCGQLFYNSDTALTCTLTIKFSTTALGARSAVLTLTDASGYRVTTLVAGRGVTSAPTVTPSLAFGNVQTSATSGALVSYVTLPNQDAATAAIAGGSTSPFKLSQNTSCPQGASTCEFSVTFSPTGLGSATDSLVVTDTATGLTATTALSGTGGVPVVSLSANSLPFGARGVGVTSITQTVTVTNMGNAALAIGGVSLTGADTGDFLIVSNTCTGTVAVSGSCAVGVNFTPAATGTRSANVQILSNAASSPDLVGLTGTGQ
jgi:trimeric autotransporter adhesin